MSRSKEPWSSNTPAFIFRLSQLYRLLKTSQSSRAPASFSRAPASFSGAPASFYGASASFLGTPFSFLGPLPPSLGPLPPSLVGGSASEAHLHRACRVDGGPRTAPCMVIWTGAQSLGTTEWRTCLWMFSVQFYVEVKHPNESAPLGRVQAVPAMLSRFSHI